MKQKFAKVGGLALLVFLSLTLLSGSGDEKDNIKKVQTYWDEVWNKGNLKAIDDFYHPNAKHGEDFTIEGFKKGVVFQRKAFPDFKATITDIFATGNKVVSEVTYTGTHTGGRMFKQEPLGKSIKVPGLDIFTFENGKCVNHQHVADHLDLVMQMGIKLVPESDIKLLEQQVKKSGKDYNDLMKRLKSGVPYRELLKTGDIAALDSTLATEYIYTSRDGMVSGKRESFEEYKGNHFTSYSAEMFDQEVRLAGPNAAVETGRIQYKGIKDSKPFELTKRYTTTWIWRNSRWQILADHTSKIGN